MLSMPLPFHDLNSVAESDLIMEWFNVTYNTFKIVIVLALVVTKMSSLGMPDFFIALPTSSSFLWGKKETSASA